MVVKLKTKMGEIIWPIKHFSTLEESVENNNKAQNELSDDNGEDSVPSQAKHQMCHMQIYI